MQKNVVEYLLKTMQNFPLKIAVKDDKAQMTFQELTERAHRISSQIRHLGIINSPVGVYIPKGCDAICSFAALSLSGNFYVPLDTKSPNSRVESIINVLSPAAIITNREHLAKIKEVTSKQVFVIEDVLEDQSLKLIPLEELMKSQIDTDPVYSIFTSGSTGTPKGVVVSHRGVIDYIDWAVETFKIDHTTVIGNQAPFYFDNSTLDIYLMY